MPLIHKFLQYEQFIFGLILLTFHSLIWNIKQDSLHFSFSIILLGIFLLWQPIWNKKQNISTVKVMLPSIIFLAIAYYYPYEALILFALLILGIFGSHILDNRSSRAFDLLAISIITLEICIGIVPLAFNQISLPALFASSFESILSVGIILFFFSGQKASFSNESRNIDMLHGILTSTLISLVLLGGIVINLLYGVDYIDGLLLTLFIVTTLTFGISWFWNPSIGFSGLGVLWNRYSMSIGSPFEEWINSLTTLIEEHYLTPQEYLQSACDHLTENDWLDGIQWNDKNRQIKSGTQTVFSEQYSVSKDSHVTLFFSAAPGTALRQHTQLLIRMANQFYIAKKNQDKIRTQEHFATIHHTGARLTHDIKNILQSIKTSLNIIHLEPNLDNNKPFKLLDQNLTQISHRLESTLNKLKTPELNTHIKLNSMSQWLKNFKAENTNSLIHFHDEIKNDLEIPVELLDSVINNLVSNATNKLSANQIKLQVICDKDIALMTVCDNGEAIEEKTVEALFNKPVSSGKGMGIGLYQSAIMAKAFNFELDLIVNETGRVCFSLMQHLKEQ